MKNSPKFGSFRSKRNTKGLKLCLNVIFNFHPATATATGNRSTPLPPDCCWMNNNFLKGGGRWLVGKWLGKPADFSLCTNARVGPGCRVHFWGVITRNEIFGLNKIHTHTLNSCCAGWKLEGSYIYNFFIFWGRNLIFMMRYVGAVHTLHFSEGWQGSYYSFYLL